MIVRTFSEDNEFTIPAAEVQKLDESHKKKVQATKAGNNADFDGDMGLIEFVRIVLRWALDIVRNKRWRTW